MSYCVEVNENGFLYQSQLSLDECSSLVIQTVDEYKENNVEIDSSIVSSLFFFSFGLILLSYKAAWIVGVIKNVVGKI